MVGSALWDRRLLTVLGKGGVGRSTVAHALALAAAAAGRRVALVEVNGAASLARGFGVAPRQAAQRVAPGLDLLSLTAAGCVEEYVADRLHVAPLARAVFRTQLMGALLDGIPGMTDLLHHGKIASLLDPDFGTHGRSPRAGTYELVVVDAPATGHGLQFLQTPAALADLTRRGPLHDECAAIAARLADPGYTGAVVVTLGEDLPVSEALDLLAGLGPVRPGVIAVAANRLLADPLPPEIPWERLAAALPPTLAAAGSRRLRQVAEQERALGRLAGAGLPLVRLPSLAAPDPVRLAAAFSAWAARGGPLTPALSPAAGERGQESVLPASAAGERGPGSVFPASPARVHVVCGVGGVGKTTLSAAMALASARAGHRTVVVTVDPARRLAEALGVALGGEPTPVPLGEGRLDALMLDVAGTFDRTVVALSPDPDQARALLGNRYYRAVVDRLAGGPEYIALVQLDRLVRDGRWDVVVVDTPPAEDALDLFRAPDRLRKVFGRSVLWALVGGGSRVAEILTRAGARTLERLIGEGVVQDIVEFFRLVAGTTGGFRAHAESVSALFASDRAATWLVLDARSPERGDADGFREALVALGPPLAGVLLNRVAPDAPEVDLPAIPAPADLPEAAWRDAVAAIGQVARDQAAEAARHRGLAARLRAVAPVWPVPELEPGDDTLVALAAHLPPGGYGAAGEAP